MTNEQIEQLRRLSALKSTGALTDEEFDQQKILVLGVQDPFTAVSSAPTKKDEQLRRLSVLKSAGALTDEECARLENRVLEVQHPSWTAKTPPKKTSKRPSQDATAVVLVSVMVVVMILGGVAWFVFQSRDNRDSESLHLYITGNANVRDAPKEQGSAVIGRLSPGETVSGTWVSGPNGSRWLELAGGGGYVWDGNISVPRESNNGSAAPDNLEAAIDPTEIMPAGAQWNCSGNFVVVPTQGNYIWIFGQGMENAWATVLLDGQGQIGQFQGLVYGLDAYRNPDVVSSAGGHKVDCTFIGEVGD